MTWREVVYEYDGSFDGLLCCIYESYTQKELPRRVFPHRRARAMLV